MGSPTTAFVHIEIVHPDPGAAAEFLHSVLGAERVERGVSGYLERFVPGAEVIHMKLANVVLQLIKPSAAMTSWSEHLREHGPSVHNVTVMVDGLKDVRRAMLNHGATHVLKAQTELSQAGLDVDDPQDLYIVDAREQTGLRFELVETLAGWTPGEAP
jgi:4-hydroxyphenylpyruvate dioxygenase-like putative hemolysin